jgi:hypothetical protein
MTLRVPFSTPASKGVGVAMDDDNYEVGYKKPPLAGRIKKGERRNPNGRPKKVNAVPAVMSDAEIVAMLDNETVEYKGRRITKREAELRVLHGKSLKGDAKAHQMMADLRQKTNADKSAKGSGVLLVPVVGSLEEWSAAAAIQQAKYRGEDPEGLAKLEAYETAREEDPGD